jgi:hypothetical protein
MTTVPMRAIVPAGAIAVLLFGCGGSEGGGSTSVSSAGTPSIATTTEAPPAAKVKRLLSLASQSQAVASKQESIRIANAQGQLLLIAQEHPEAIEPLTDALKEPDYDLIADLYNFYIQLGKPGSERVLIEALDRQGFTPTSSPMAFAFLASGNKKLVQGARQWAEENGLTITGNPSGVVGPKWGEVGLAVPTVPTAPPPAP